MKKLLLLALCALLSANADARTLYVDAKRPNNKGSGLSAKKAKKTIQAAVNVAKKGDTIVVYPGKYTPIKTKNKKVAIKSVKGKSQTYIQAAVNNVCLADLGTSIKKQRGYDRYEKKYRKDLLKFKGGNSSVLAGFTLRSKPFKSDGGDQWNHCYWRDAAVAGGTVKSCAIDHCGYAWMNIAYTRTASGSKTYSARSATIYKSKLTGCTISACGGGYPDTFTKNYAEVLTPESGLGICASTLSRCKVVGNGGRFGFWTDGPADQHNPFLVHDSKFYNCLIAENERMQADNCVFANCTIAKNSNFAMTKSKVQSCIVYKCGKTVFKSAKKNKFTNTFKDDRDPKFVDYAGGEFHLTSKSPCINKGKKVSGTGSVDLDGEKRARGTVDMGCYEYFAAQNVRVKFMEYTDDFGAPWILFSEKTYSQPKTYGSLPTPKWENHFFAGWWTDPIAGKQVFASSAVTAYRLYPHWVYLYSSDKTRTSCECFFHAVYARVEANGDSFEQTIGNLAVVVPSKLDGLSVTGFFFFDNVRIKVTSVSIPSSFTSIDDWAFGNCTSLASITIPNSVTSIGNYVFGDCTSLTSVTIPKSLTSVGDNPFYNCPRLKTIRLQNGSPLVPGEDFENPDGCKVVRY